ncbi:hypothetical protein LX32DRAFT_204996 [Colletotrichum zoysiae]|uniref:Uncharacterized protein n=1 Tax=Colletotrichum zoysiae TaxID=1216348 RepID=A0AAD9LXT4_9PEZI|nr:hypothetical protein LX32DRAFT_204996 [Colletotrichum zoysiae]
MVPSISELSAETDSEEAAIKSSIFQHCFFPSQVIQVWACILLSFGQRWRCVVCMDTGGDGWPVLVLFRPIMDVRYHGVTLLSRGGAHAHWVGTGGSGTRMETAVILGGVAFCMGQGTPRPTSWKAQCIIPKRDAATLGVTARFPSGCKTGREADDRSLPGIAKTTLSREKTCGIGLRDQRTNATT